MKIISNLLIMLLVCTAVSAQYCGNSGPAACAPDSSLPQPGIMDYRQFPCVDRAVAFSSAIQLYFPDTINYGGTIVSPDSVRIDSITNMPCGMCWSSDKAGNTFHKLERGCINISGTTTDSAGSYLLGLYGTAYVFGLAVNGSLNQFWTNFYVSVKDAGAACTHSTSPQRTACASGPVGPPCTGTVAIHQVPIPHCSPDSITLYVDSGYTSAMWDVVIYSISDTFYGQRITIPWTPEYVGVHVRDAANCTASAAQNMTRAGIQPLPSVCYLTSDTSLQHPNVIMAFERDDWNHNILRYALKDSQGNVLDTVNSSRPGYLYDSTAITPYYMIEPYGVCGDTSIFPFGYRYSHITIDTLAGGYPHISWPLQMPTNYTAIYVMARPIGGAWYIKDTLYSVNVTSLILTYTDLHPDSTLMDYMLAYDVSTACDPSRSAPRRIFTAMSHTYTLRGGTGPNSLDDITAAAIHLYPVPAGDALTIDHSGLLAGTAYSLTDLTGREVLTGRFTHSQTTLSLSDAAPGVYILHAAHAGTYKVVKK